MNCFIQEIREGRLHKRNDIWARSSKLFKQILGYSNMVFNGTEASKYMLLDHTSFH